MLQAWKGRNWIHDSGVVTDGKTTIERPRPRYENDIKVDFVDIGGDDKNSTHFKPDIKNYWRIWPKKKN